VLFSDRGGIEQARVVFFILKRRTVFQPEFQPETFFA